MVTEPWAPVSRSDMPSLTGLRCLAASAVFFAHISFALSETSLASALPWLESIGRTGVALFFVLSGYLLTQPGTLRGGLRSYGARRFARVYPTYLVATATFVAVGYVQNPSNLPRAGNALLNVSLLQSWAWGGWGVPRQPHKARPVDRRSDRRQAQHRCKVDFEPVDRAATQRAVLPAARLDEPLLQLGVEVLRSGERPVEQETRLGDGVGPLVLTFVGAVADGGELTP